MDHIFRRLSFKDLMKFSPVAAALVLVNLAVYIFGFTAENFLGWDRLFNLGGLNSVLVFDRGEYWRLFTAGFIHNDLIHLLFNVGFGIYIISAGLERLIGSVRFSIIYFVGLIGSSLVVVLFSNDVYQVDNIIYLVPTAGASGAIFAVIGTLLYITFVRPDMISRGEAGAIRQLVIINIIFTFLVSNISVQGHLGGLLVGLVISYLVVPRDRNYIEDQYVYDYTNDEDNNNWWEN